MAINGEYNNNNHNFGDFDDDDEEDNDDGDEDKKDDVRERSNNHADGAMMMLTMVMKMVRVLQIVDPAILHKRTWRPWTRFKNRRGSPAVQLRCSSVLY